MGTVLMLAACGRTVKISGTIQDAPDTKSR